MSIGCWLDAVIVSKGCSTVIYFKTISSCTFAHLQLGGLQPKVPCSKLLNTSKFNYNEMKAEITMHHLLISNAKVFFVHQNQEFSLPFQNFWWGPQVKAQYLQGFVESKNFKPIKI